MESAKKRLVSIDAYRGLVMFLMLAEMLHLSRLAEVFPNQPIFQWLRFHTTHVEWTGCSLHDLIQPGFSFLVGVSLVFSIASRKAKGQSDLQMLIHAIGRSLILIFLGIFLRSLSYEHTNFTFDDTLTQIGLGYTFLFLIGRGPRWSVYVAFATILVLYWTAFLFYPVAGPEFDYAAVGVDAEFAKQYNHDGFLAHWNKNSNLAWTFDIWWMNLFHRSQPFLYSAGGYATLSFIPTLATMLLGVIAGGWLRNVDLDTARVGRFAIAIIVCLGAGWLLDQQQICPIVKRIWTPAWVLYSGGWCLAFLLAFHVLCDLRGWQQWTFPLRVIGANSIVAYVMDWTMKDWVAENLIRHLGHQPFRIFGESLEHGLVGIATFSIFWLILYWLYRQKIFVRI